MPTQIKEASKEINLEKFTVQFQQIKPEHLIMFSVQLANMIDAGLTLISSLNIISNQNNLHN